MAEPAGRGDDRVSAPMLGVYAHWPFCARICPYCDFNVYRNRAPDAPRWRDALVRDLESAAEPAPRVRLKSLYFGGGTPSLAPLGVIEAVIEACGRIWGFEEGAEITIEANPTDAERARFRAFKEAGVNRLSLGVQSFDDAALAFLGREHDGAGSRRALETALGVFGNVSFDLIYALPEETPAALRTRLRQALSFGAPHLSLYQLTIEEGTAFARRRARGELAPPSDDIAADLFEVAQEETARAGLPAYEVSNHAAEGARSRHNLLYWTGGDYVGIGPGAHGRATREGARVATETYLAPEAYLRAVETRGSGVRLAETLSAAEARIERFSMGLRLAEGFSPPESDLAALAAPMAALAAEGLVARAEGRVRTTPQGRLLLDTVLARLFA